MYSNHLRKNSIFRENMPSHFKVKEYCPLVFRNLRERFGIDDQDYKESMTRYAVLYSSISLTFYKSQPNIHYKFLYWKLFNSILQ